MIWLSQVKDTRQPLSAQAPIGVRRRTVTSGTLVPSPERHPYYECGILLEGEVIQVWGKEEARRRRGDVFLAAAGVPHWAREVKYPVTSIAVYFLPSVVMEMGPQGDGLHLLLRFFAEGMEGCLVRPPASLAKKLCDGFADIAEEFDDHRPGRELRLRARLALLLTEFDRWQHSKPTADPVARNARWTSIQQALRYLQEHYAQPVYSSELAAHMAMSESGLRALFRQTIGIPWGRYLQIYRVNQAVPLLASGELNVTEVAGAVGFESLNHFESTFRTFTGMSPIAFARTSRTE